MDFLRQYTMHKDLMVIPVTAICHFLGAKPQYFLFLIIYEYIYQSQT